MFLLILLLHSSKRGDSFPLSYKNSQRRNVARIAIFATKNEPIFYNDFDDSWEATATSTTSDEPFVLTLDNDVTKNKDWRDVRRNLVAGKKRSMVSKANKAVLKKQNKELAKEEIWAHDISMVRSSLICVSVFVLTYCYLLFLKTKPEPGGLVVRLPLEAEIWRTNRLGLQSSETTDTPTWYRQAQARIESVMLDISETGAEDGQVDPSKLPKASAELLRLYLEHQETWQEVCLVLSSRSTVVLNRPMAFKLTDAMARLVLYGSMDQDRDSERNAPLLKDFLRVFGAECAVYVGGPDDQNRPAQWIHGIEELGGQEIAPGIFLGGDNIRQAISGVREGRYRPLDFRFFVGCHKYEGSDKNSLVASVFASKYQPVACSRSLALKQCIQLPQPLWHEVLGLCGGELEEISKEEQQKRDDIRFEIVDEEEEFHDDEDEFELLDDEDYEDDDEDDDVNFYRT